MCYSDWGQYKVNCAKWYFRRFSSITYITRERLHKQKNRFVIFLRRSSQWKSITGYVWYLFFFVLSSEIGMNWLGAGLGLIIINSSLLWTRCGVSGGLSSPILMHEDMADVMCARRGLWSTVTSYRLLMCVKLNYEHSIYSFWRNLHAWWQIGYTMFMQ